ncbi:MAG: IMPACT family protein [Adhaeribacter sp.]
MATPPSDTFLTLAAPSQGIYKEKGSKFIALAYPVSTESEVRDIYARLKKEYFDARHHCYAYLLGAGGSRYRANDDGEPNHSAGDPILGQIRSAGLSNVLVVVVRYFGGIKLGVSGLIQAYREAAAQALAAGQVVEKVEKATLHLAFGYDQMNAVMSLVKDYQLDVLEQDFGLSCRLVLAVRRALAEEVFSRLSALGEARLG